MSKWIEKSINQTLTDHTITINKNPNSSIKHRSIKCHINQYSKRPLEPTATSVICLRIAEIDLQPIWNQTTGIEPKAIKNDRTTGDRKASVGWSEIVDFEVEGGNVEKGMEGEWRNW